MNIESLGASSIHASQVSGATPMVGGSGAQGRMDGALSEVAQMLKMSTSQLSTALGSSNSLTDVAASLGASKDSVLSAITKGIRAAAAADNRSLPDSSVSHIAERIANYRGVRQLLPNGMPPNR